MHRIKPSRVFMSGRSQAVRIPVELRLETQDVWMWREVGTGFLIVATSPPGWQSFSRLRVMAREVPEDFPRRARQRREKC